MNKKSLLLVIDEVQKVSNWSEAVKKEWDVDTRTKTPIKVVILGSSRLLLQQGLTVGQTHEVEAKHLEFSLNNYYPERH